MSREMLGANRRHNVTPGGFSPQKTKPRGLYRDARATKAAADKFLDERGLGQRPGMQELRFARASK